MLVKGAARLGTISTLGDLGRSPSHLALPSLPNPVGTKRPGVGGGVGEWQVAAVSVFPRELRACPRCVGRGFGVTQTQAPSFQTRLPRLGVRVGLAGGPVWGMVVAPLAFLGAHL